MSGIVTRTLANGLVVIVEPMASVSSAALCWLLPGGSAVDPADRDGQATMLSELILRGAGGRSSRQLSDALDRQGVERDASVSTHHLALNAVMVGSRLHEALPVLTDIVLAPALPDDAMEPVRQLCLQAIDGMNDDPQHLAMLRLREQHQASPFNRHGFGERAAVESITIDELRQAWSARAVPQRSILALAGAVDPEAALTLLERLTGAWRGTTTEPRELAGPRRGRLHVDHDSAQVHIGAAWDAPPEKNPDSMTERVAVNVLSGGTSARLFTEVRQKRSLCYSVGASYSTGRDTGLVALYAGTTPQRAAQTLEVALAEVERLRDGARDDEFHRAVIGLKSHLVMQGESTSARAMALARDHFRVGRARSLDELAAQVDAVTLDSLNAYLARRRFGPYTVVTVGPAAVAQETARC